MKIALRSPLFLLLAISLFSSCTKSSNISGSGGYYFKFKANGNQVDMPLQDHATVNYVSSLNIYGGVMQGSTSDAKQTMLIEIYNNTDIIANTTLTQQFVTGLTIPQVQLSYVDGSGTGFVSGTTILNSQAEATVTISDITSSYIKGTFSGKILTGDYSAIKYTITDGQFYVKRSN